MDLGVASLLEIMRLSSPVKLWRAFLQCNSG